MAVGIEILIVLSLIAYEVMTEHEREQRSKPAEEEPRSSEAKAVAIGEPIKEPEKGIEAAPIMETLSVEDKPKAFPVPPRPRLIASRPDPVGNIAVIMAEIMEPGRGKVEIADVFAAYAEGCQRCGKRPIPANDFPNALVELCERLKIEIKSNEKGVFLLKVKD